MKKIEKPSKAQKLMPLLGVCSFVGVSVITFLEPSKSLNVDASYHLVAAMGALLTVAACKWHQTKTVKIQK